MRGPGAVAGGDAQEEGVVFFEFVRGDGGDVGGFGGCVHFGEDFGWEGLADLEEVAGAAGGFDAGFFGHGEFVDVAVHGVLLWRGEGSVSGRRSVGG